MTWPPSNMILWNTAQRWATLEAPSYMASQYCAYRQKRVFPFILNRPYPTTGWLGLVPTSNTDLANALTPESGGPASSTRLVAHD